MIFIIQPCLDFDKEQIALLFFVFWGGGRGNYEVRYKTDELYFKKKRDRIIRGRLHSLQAHFDAYKIYFQGTTDAQIKEQQQLSKDAIHGIIGGVIGFCSVVVVIVAIVTQRRPCNRGWFSQGYP